MTTWLDPARGVVEWSPFCALAFVALWRLWRSRRERLAVAVFDQVDVEVTAAFLALIVAAVALTAAFAAPSLDGGARVWTHARHMVPALPALAALSAWGWRFVPRTGAALGGGDARCQHRSPRHPRLTHPTTASRDD